MDEIIQMGLDSVELLLEVEKIFKITIPDKEAEQIRSVGELYDSILAKTAGRDIKPERVWEELRNIFINRFKIAPEEIKKRGVDCPRPRAQLTYRRTWRSCRRAP